jgi:hypothetical protein
MTESTPPPPTITWPVPPVLPGYAPQLPGPPPPPRRRGLIVAVAATIVFSAIVAGGAAFVAGVALRHHASAAQPHQSVTSVRIGDGDALRPYLLKRPAAATAVKIDESSFGVQTPSEYVDDHYDDFAFELARMKARGLVTAALEAWRLPGSDEVFIQLLQFRSADGAQSYVLANGSGYADDASTTQTVRGVADAHAYAWDTADENGRQRVVILGRLGNVAVLVDTYTTGVAVPSNDVALFQRQYAALTP